MAQRRVTSISVARLARVSQATVSRTFANHSAVSASTRERVLAAALELGYTPNALARSLITRHTTIVGIVMAHITSPFYPYVLEMFVQKLEQIGLQALLFSTAPDQEIDDILPQVLQYQVSALILTSAMLSSRTVEACARSGTPIILFNRNLLGAQASAVCCDNVEGGRLVANCLLDAGHKRLAYIAGTPEASTTIDREKGFADRLRERGVATLLREQGQYTYESGYEAARRLFESDAPPDAVFCANDITAIGALDLARDRAIRVPQDVSFIGFDDIPMAAWSAYRLTTIRQPVDQMIDATLQLLRRQLAEPEMEPVTRLLPGALIARSSARLPADAVVTDGGADRHWG